MNIALVNPEYPSPSGRDQGGIATYTYSMANALAQQGCRVYVLVKKGTVPKLLGPTVIVEEYHHATRPGITRWISRLFPEASMWEQGFSWGLRNKLLEIHNKNALDIVEIPEYNGLAYELHAPLPFPVIVHFHTPTVLVDFYNAQKIDESHKRCYQFEAKALKNATAFRSPSTALTLEMCQRYAIKQDLVTIIKHPFDTATFDAIKKENRQDNCIDILFVGRLERRKGAEVIRSAINQILGIDPRIRITIAGESSIGAMGNYRDAIELSLGENQRKRVFFLGATKRDKLPVLYCRSDIFCMPSLFENTSYSLLEAMAAKLPIVASRTGGIPELITHNENGLLFNPENTQELVNCTCQLIADKKQALIFGQRAYSVVKSACDPGIVAKTVIDYYKSILGSL